MFIPLVAFMSLKAQSVYEYGITFYTVIAIPLIATYYYTVIIFKMGKILNLIE